MFLRKWIALVLGFAIGSIVSNAFAYDVILDTGFDGDGILNARLSSSDTLCYDIAITSDGKIIAVGQYGPWSFLTRYWPWGTLDTTFGSSGISATPSVGAHKAVAIDDSDGSIIVGGAYANGSNFDFAVALYYPQGLLDMTFGTSGIATTAIGSGYDYCEDVVIQSDGKILAGGYYDNGSDYDFALVRYDTTGIQDNTFGTNGIVTTAIGSGDDKCYDLALQSNGKILAAGYSHNGSNYDYTVVRYNTDGTLDTSFGTNGVVTTDIDGFNDYCEEIAVQSDGKIVVGGYYANDSSVYNVALVRYDSDGTLDTTFGTNGIVTTDVTGGSVFDYCYDVLIDPNGKIIAAGYNSSGNPILVRYDSSGNLDTVFDGDGMDTFTTPYSSQVHAAEFQNDGKLVLGGIAINFFPALQHSLELTCYTTDTGAYLYVELIYFKTIQNDDNIILEWLTATEKNNAGFNIWRSDTPDGEYQRINDILIPSEGNEYSGKLYQYEDAAAQPGKTYYYKLEDIDYSGVSTFHPLFGNIQPDGIDLKSVNISSAIQILQLLVRNRNETVDATNFDFNSNGYVGLDDAVHVLQHIAGIRSQ